MKLEVGLLNVLAVADSTENALYPSWVGMLILLTVKGVVGKAEDC